MFKRGDKIMRLVTGYRLNHVTKGKIYIVIACTGPQVVLLDDNNNKDVFTSANFSLVKKINIPKEI